MSSIELEESFKLFNDDNEITFSIFENKLLFIHSPFTSSQFALDEIGVNLMEQESCLQLQFYIDGGTNYLSLFFRNDQYDGLLKYFKRLGYPMPQYPRLKRVNEKGVGDNDGFFEIEVPKNNDK